MTTRHGLVRFHGRPTLVASARALLLCGALSTAAACTPARAQQQPPYPPGRGVTAERTAQTIFAHMSIVRSPPLAPSIFAISLCLPGCASLSFSFSLSLSFSLPYRSVCARTCAICARARTPYHRGPFTSSANSLRRSSSRSRYLPRVDSLSLSSFLFSCFLGRRMTLEMAL